MFLTLSLAVMFGFNGSINSWLINFVYCLEAHLIIKYNINAYNIFYLRHSSVEDLSSRLRLSAKFVKESRLREVFNANSWNAKTMPTFFFG